MWSRLTSGCFRGQTPSFVVARIAACVAAIFACYEELAAGRREGAVTPRKLQVGRTDCRGGRPRANICGRRDSRAHPPAPGSGMTWLSTSHLRRHSRFSDNDSIPFCFPVLSKAPSYDSCVTIAIHHYYQDTCGPCNN